MGVLESVFLENRAALLRFLAARKASRDEAEDILQDMFLKLEAVQPTSVSEPRAYLYRMAENLLCDRRRTARRRASREESWVGTQLGVVREADNSPSAEQVLIAREDLARVARSLSGLPDRTLQILRRFRLDGVAQRDIAAEFGISVSAVEKHLHRAYRAVLEARTSLDAEVAHRLRP